MKRILTLLLLACLMSGCAMLRPHARTPIRMGVIGGEVGSYANATSPLLGTERLLGDQASSYPCVGCTVNVTPSQIAAYTASLAINYSLVYNNNGVVGGLIPGSIGQYCPDWTSLSAPPTLVPCPTGATFQANGAGLSSQATVNFTNSVATDGLTLEFLNPSLGNVQLALVGTLTYAGGGTGLTSPPANGQVLIGTGSGYALTTLTAGANITITNSSGSIMIAAPGGTGVSSLTAGASGNLTVSPTTGTAVADLASQATNTVCANISGASAIPSCGTTLATFQAALVSANAQTVSASPGAGPLNDYAPTGFGATTGLLILTPSANSTIDGLMAGSNLQEVILVNNSATYPISLVAQSASDSTAANRFLEPGSGLTIGPQTRAICFYLGGSVARWNCQ